MDNQYNKQLEIEKKKILFVEGKDDADFFKALFKELKIGSDIQIINFNGINSFKPVFIGLYNNSDGFSNVTHLGFVRDAEKESAINAFKSICKVVKKKKISCPKSLKNNNEKNKKPYVGIYIMPDNKMSGMLEDLCLKSIKKEPIKRSIDSYIKNVKKKIGSKIKNFNESKARIQTYLASKIPIKPRLGEGAFAGHFNFNNPCFSDIKKFIQEFYY